MFRLIGKIIRKIKREVQGVYYRNVCKQFGQGSVIRSAIALNGKENMAIGNNVNIGWGVWLAAVPHTGEKECCLHIGNNSAIGNFNHIYATKGIYIDNHVLTADRVYISDNLHGYEDVDTPIIKQPIVQKNEVFIGEGTWIGEGVSIIGASIGKHCVIGANSVVTKNIPDYCVAVGIPAKVIKKYSKKEKKWIKV